MRCLDNKLWAFASCVGTISLQSFMTSKVSKYRDKNLTRSNSCSTINSSKWLICFI